LANAAPFAYVDIAEALATLANGAPLAYVDNA
jgi:hypothetical protein